MPTLVFLPARKAVSVPAGVALIEAARAAGVEIDKPCGGKGTCGKCIVRVIRGQVESHSLGLLPPAAVAEGYVLACQSTVLDQDVEVEIPERLGYEGGKFGDEDETHLIRPELLPKEWNFDPLAVRWYLNVQPPQPEDGLGDLGRLTRAIQREWGKQHVLYTLPVLRAMADALRAQNGRVTVTLIREPGHLHVIRIEPGDATTRHFGIAVDVGTTTVAVHLIHLALGKILATRSDYNGQIPCGLDVISRINYASRPGGLAELRQRVLETVNRLISQAAASHGVAPEEITNAVISGNTTMIHLLLGLKPEYIRLAPYTPTVLEAPYLTAAEVGLCINHDSWVYFSPAVGSYVGGDITAGILCTDLATESEAVSLFIDIGTNGEIVVGNRDFLMACACSAGPAFEGGGIECGMRAAVGAIESVKIDPATGVARCATIGGVKPKGICGSGMIELLADLFLSGWLDAAGKFDRTRPCPAIRIEDKRAYYVLASAEESGTARPIIVSEIDIENILRAKAAIYSACSLLLAEAGMSFADIANLYIAGGFGRYLDLSKAIVIGLLPDLPAERFHYIGNASLMGSYMVVLSQDFRERQLELARRMTYFDLSTTPAYMDQYTAALFLPHTDSSRFPTVAQKRAQRQKEMK